jgi:hypothetical protein
MTWTTLLDELPLSGSWQKAPESEFSLYRFSFVSGDLTPTGFSRYEVGQFDEDGSGFNLRSYRTEQFGLLVILRKPQFFETQCLGFRVPAGFNPFVLKVEVNDMPVSPSGDSAPLAGSVVSTTSPAVTTPALLVAANPNRKSLSIQNAGTAVLFIDFDGTVSTTSYQARIPSNGYFEPPVNYTGAIHGVWSAASGAAEIREYV